MPRVVLLGPQRDRPTAGAALRDLEVAGPVATVTAGWQEWEAEDEALRADLGRDTLPLSLHARAERVWAADPELAEAHRAMQRDVRALQRAYRRRLDHAADSWMELLAADGPERILGPERAGALESIQRLDAHHLARIGDLRAEFEERTRPLERDAVARERAEIERDLAAAAAVVVEGGHVAVLHNRLALFGVVPLLADKPVIGCAGGAMLLGSRVVLYDDTPAIGRGHAEVGLPGLELVPGVLALPDAKGRLRLDDRARMRRLALRFAPDRCVVLDAGDRLDWDGEGLAGRGGARVEEDGAVVPWEVAA